MWCPRCEQGEVVKVKVNKKNEIIYVCEECEATWFYESDVGEKPFIDFEDHMVSLGLKTLWSEVTVMLE